MSNAHILDQSDLPPVVTRPCLEISEGTLGRLLRDNEHFRRQVDELQKLGSAMAKQRQHMLDANRLADLARKIAASLPSRFDTLLEKRIEREVFRLLVEHYREPAPE